MYSNRYLFTDSDLRTFLQTNTDNVMREIVTRDTKYILGVDPQKYAEHLISEYTFEIPCILEDEIHVGQEEVSIDVSQDQRRIIPDRTRPLHVTGTRVTYYIPFTGDASLFRYRPSRFTTSPPEGAVLRQELLLSFDGISLTAEDVTRTFSKALDDIKKWLGFLSSDITDYNQKLTQDIESKIKARREKLLEDSSLVASLGFPLREIPGAPMTYTVPANRKKIIPESSASVKAFEPEPEISMEHYEHI